MILYGEINEIGRSPNQKHLKNLYVPETKAGYLNDLVRRYKYMKKEKKLKIYKGTASTVMM